jgi:hypothetical protein
MAAGLGTTVPLQHLVQGHNQHKKGLTGSSKGLIIHTSQQGAYHDRLSMYGNPGSDLGDLGCQDLDSHQDLRSRL